MIKIITGFMLILFSVAAKAVDVVYISNNQFSVTREVDNNGKVRLNLKDNQGKQSSMILSLGERLIDAANYQNKLMVLVETRSVYRVIVLDKASNRLLDNFYASFASLSPNGRYAVFQRFVGRQLKTAQGYAVGETRIYDVHNDPMTNRTQSGRKEFKQYSADQERPYLDAGIPLYPLGDYEAPNYGFTSTYQQGIAVLDRYYWVDTSTVVFLTMPFKSKFKIIKATLPDSGHINNTNLTIHPVNLTDYFDSEVVDFSNLNVEAFPTHINIHINETMVRLAI